MDYDAILRKRIQTLCQARGFSYNKLATLSNVSQSTLDNIMRGLSKDPRITTLHKLALTFNMTVAEFLDFPELNHFSFDEDTQKTQ